MCVRERVCACLCVICNAYFYGTILLGDVSLGVLVYGRYRMEGIGWGVLDGLLDRGLFYIVLEGGII